VGERRALAFSPDRARMESLLSDLERNKRVVVDYYQTALPGTRRKPSRTILASDISSTIRTLPTGLRRSRDSSTGCAASTRG